MTARALSTHDRLPPPLGPPSTREPLRLLLLEDSPADAALLEARLRSAGVRASITRVVSRGDFIAAVAGPFDAIIADFTLPEGFDALEALDIVARLGVFTPVVVVTGAVGEELASECVTRGAAAYLLKDRLRLLPATLADVLERCGDAARGR